MNKKDFFIFIGIAIVFIIGIQKFSIALARRDLEERIGSCEQFRDWASFRVPARCSSYFNIIYPIK